MLHPGQMILSLQQNIGKAVVGKEEAVEYALIALLCKGHVLIEDVPGVGNHPGQRNGQISGLLLSAHSVYTGSDAFRCYRIYAGQLQDRRDGVQGRRSDEPDCPGG